MHAFDRQTDRQTDRWAEFLSLDRGCIPCSAVKINYMLAITITHLTLLQLHELDGKFLIYDYNYIG